MKSITKVIKAMVFVVIAFMGAIDVNAYDVVNGVKCEPVWEISRNNGKYDTHLLAENYKNIRTATIYGDAGNEKVILSWSKPVGDTYQATLIIMDIYTREIEKEVALTYNGAPIEGLLCANQIGVDDFGNLWIASYLSSIRVLDKDALGNDIVTNAPLKIYVVSDVYSGICDYMYELKDNCDYSDHDFGESIDFCDIVGDVTGVESHAVCFAVINSSKKHVARWQLYKGEKKWEAGFDGYTCWWATGHDVMTYPTGLSKWGTAMCYIINGNQFYIDGELNCPSIYGTSMNYIDGFSYNETLAPIADAMGCTEFGFTYKEEFVDVERFFMAYSIANYNSSELGCQFCIAEFEKGNLLFEKLIACWTLPDIGFGTHEVSGAMKLNCLDSKKIIDDEGREGVLLLSYCCGNGLGLYLIADEKFKSDRYVSSVSEFESEKIEIFTQNSNIVINGTSVGDNIMIYNMQGVLLKNVSATGECLSVDMPMDAIYIVKCNDVVKKVIL